MKNKKPSTLYSIAAAAVKNLSVGESTTIKAPEKIKSFRKYISEIGQREDKKFTTKVDGSKITIMRVEYFNIHSGQK